MLPPLSERLPLVASGRNPVFRSLAHAGLRHLAWDNGVGQNIPWNVKTGYAAFAGATAVGVFAMLYEKKAERLA